MCADWKELNVIAFIIPSFSLAVSLAALVASCGSDLKSRIIPNEFVLAVAVSGLALGLCVRPSQLPLSVCAAAGVLIGLGVLSHNNLIGGGDVKLVAAVTLLLPPDRIWVLLYAIALAGGALSCAYLAAGIVLKKTFAGNPDAHLAWHQNGFGLWVREERERIASGRSVPYALAIFGGFAVCFKNEIAQCYFAISCSF
jgi:prepilin peptidase CpaA